MAEIQLQAASSKHEGISLRSCRVCTAEGEIMWPIFGPNTQDHISVKLTYCTGLQISQTDGKPLQICGQCLDNLNTAHLFKKLCLISDAAFEKLLKSNAVKVEPFKKEPKVKVEMEDSDDDFLDTISDTENQKVIETIIPPVKVKDINRKKAATKMLSTKGKIEKNIVKRKPITVRKKSEAESLLKIKDKHIAGLIIKKISTDLIRSERKTQKKSILNIKKLDSKLYCKTCDIRFKKKQEMDLHIKAEHPDQRKKYVCESCGKSYYRRTSLHAHVQYHKPPKFRCNLCDYGAYNKSDLQKHSTIHTGEKKFKCEYCALAFAVSSNLKQHIRRAHLKDMPHKCHICEKAFVAPSYLKEHLESHSNTKNQSCEYCDAKFVGRRQLRRHLQKQHNVNIPPLRIVRRRKAQLCGKVYLSQGGHFSHMQSHQPPRYLCTLCPYTTHSKDNMAKHNTVHTGEKKFKCDQCPAAFAVRSNLNHHNRIVHIKDKPHKCQQCGAAFTFPYDLRIHADSHNNVKKYSCDICQSNFSRREHWKKHLLKLHGIKLAPLKHGPKQHTSETDKCANSGLSTSSALHLATMKKNIKRK